MTKLIRVTAVVGMLWSLFVTAILWLIGLILEHTDMFNGPHTTVLAIITLLEIGLLFTLLQAFRLRVWAVPVLLGWFVLASAPHTSPAGLRDWADAFLLLLIALAPVTLTMILLALHSFSSRPRNISPGNRGEKQAD
jgi:hypothetical protein